ncbi:MAG TPA: RNA polymerase sigma factor [Fimbriiglobus sp.]|jgi:RNA polymerase sigma factor (sigma-70 family)
MTGSFLKDLMHRVGSLAANAADAPADGELLARFVRDRDESAFAGLMARHAPLVWGVCRGLLAHDADAEDAFQATFLSLVRGAKNVRTTHTLAPWLHATAMRVAKKARLSAGRRSARDRNAAKPEANGAAVPDSTWDSAFLTVHEEIARLPDAMRSAFVLCVLEGDRHADAAAKLGVPVGTLSARVSRARQRLMDALTARGLAPAAAAAALALGGAVGPAAVPASLMHTTCSTLLAGATAVPASVLNLARMATEGSVMKAKLLAAGVMIAAGLGLSGGAARFGVAEAQSPPPTDSRLRFTYNSVPGYPGTGWEYRFEELPTDFGAFEKILTSLGKERWDYVGSEVFRDQPTRKMVFKRPTATAYTAITTGSTMAYVPTPIIPPATNFNPLGLQPPTDPNVQANNRTAMLRLASADAAAVAAKISDVFNGPGKTGDRVLVSADSSGKQVIIRCSPADAATIIQLIAKSNLATKIEMDFAPAAKLSAVAPTLPNGSGSTNVTRFFELDLPTGVTRTEAEKKAAEIAKAFRIEIDLVESPKKDGHISGLLKGSVEDIAAFKDVLPDVVQKLARKTK